METDTQKLQQYRRLQQNIIASSSCDSLQNPTSTSSSPSGTSAVKLNSTIESVNNELDNTSDESNFFILMHFGIMKNLFEECACCPECNSPLSLTHNANERQGFSHKICVACSFCTYTKMYFTSPQFTPPARDARGKKAHEINYRTVMAFREIGRGHEGMKTFTTMMNMASPLAFTSYNDINSTLHDIYENVAAENTKKAAVEVRKIINNGATSDDIVDCQISIDGTWQKRGHSSLNGVVVAISKDNRKVLDFHTMSKFCKSCEVWSKRKERLNIWDSSVVISFFLAQWKKIKLGLPVVTEKKLKQQNKEGKNLEPLRKATVMLR